MLRASASAALKEEALGKRAAGSLARERRITIDKAGGISGLIRAGSGGGSVTCCIMMVDGLFP